LRGFLDAIELVMETGFAITALVSMILNLALPEEIEDTDVIEEVTILTPIDDAVSKGQVVVQKECEV
jgi:hypothetical protein